MRHAHFIAAVLGLTCAVFASSAQTIIYVDDDAPLGGDGTTWQTAFTHLQDAVAAANALDHTAELRIAQGTYRPDLGDGITPGDTGARFRPSRDFVWLGGYAGLGTPDPDYRDFEVHVTLVSGDLDENDLPGHQNRDGNASQAIFVSNPIDDPSVPCTISGITFAGFKSSAMNYERCNGLFIEDTQFIECALRAVRFVPDDSLGPSTFYAKRCQFRDNNGQLDLLYGGILNLDDVLDNDHAFTVEDCEFIGTFRGQSIKANDFDVLIRRCTFSGGDSSELGGGIAVDQVTGNHHQFVRIEDCDFIDLDPRGPVIEGSSRFSPEPASTLTISNCTFQRCRSGGLFDAIVNTGEGTATVSRCVFEDNTGTPLAIRSTAVCEYSEFYRNMAPEFGGGIRSWGSARIENCVFENNRADQDGGAIYARGGTHIQRCTFTSNFAEWSGGAIFLEYSGSDAETVTVHNSMFIGNQTLVFGGGALYAEDVPFDLIGCTVAMNLTGDGAAVEQDFLSDSSARVISSIIWGNTSDYNDPQFDEFRGSFTRVLEHSLIHDYQGTGPGLLTGDPLFIDPLGPDAIPGTGDEDLRLQATSPCIDAGSNAGWLPESPPLDLDANPRFVNDPAAPDSGNGIGAIADMGAYERQSPCRADVSGNGLLETNDFVTFLNAYVSADPSANYNLDAILNTADFIAYLSAYVTGCP